MIGSVHFRKEMLKTEQSGPITEPLWNGARQLESLRPGHVFVFLINDGNLGGQTANPFLYNTFLVAQLPFRSGEQ